MGLDAHTVPEDPLAARAAVEIHRFAHCANVFVLHAALGRIAALAARLVVLAVVIGIRLATGVGTSGRLLGLIGHTYLRICLFRGISSRAGDPEHVIDDCLAMSLKCDLTGQRIDT